MSNSDKRLKAGSVTMLEIPPERMERMERMERSDYRLLFERRREGKVWDQVGMVPLNARDERPDLLEIPPERINSISEALTIKLALDSAEKEIRHARNRTSNKPTARVTFDAALQAVQDARRHALGGLVYGCDPDDFFDSRWDSKQRSANER